MPANLTPQYQKAENEFRRAQTPQEKSDCLERMLKLIPKHKGTEKLQADIKSRLKEAKAELQADKQSPKKGKSYKFPRQGAGRVVLIGPPNSGKSRVMAELTNAHPEVAPYAFTTREPLPGMMPWEDVSVQLIDTPPVAAGHVEPYITNLVRAADGVLLCLDGSSDDGPDETAEVLSQLQARKTLLDTSTGFAEDDFSLLRIQTLLVVTRGNDPGCDHRLEYFRDMTPTPFQTVAVELDEPTSIERLRNAIYGLLNVIRVYTKRPSKPPDYSSPFTIPRDGTIDDLALQVHRDLAVSLKFAKVWGKSAHDGQTVGREHQLCDRDLVELHV